MRRRDDDMPCKEKRSFASLSYGCHIAGYGSVLYKNVLATSGKIERGGAPDRVDKMARLRGNVKGVFL
jgi:hypothetical protein